MRASQNTSWTVSIAALTACVLYALPLHAQDPRYAIGGPYDPPLPAQAPPGGVWNGSYQPYQTPTPPLPGQTADPRAGSAFPGAVQQGAAPPNYVQQIAAPPSYAQQPPAVANGPSPSPWASSSFGNSVVQESDSPKGWIAGVGVYYFQPRWGNNPAYGTAVNTSDTAPAVQTAMQQDFSTNGGFAPLIWLGYVGDSGLGARVRWSQFHSSTSLSIDNPAQADPNQLVTVYSANPLGVGFNADSSPDLNNTLQFNSSLTMEVTDVEIIRDWHFGRGSLLFGAGLRYAHINQTYNASWLSAPVVALSTDTIDTELTSGHTFDAIGPLLSLEMRYPIGNGGLALLASGRGALLVGTGHQNANMMSTDTDIYGNVYQSLVSNGSSSGGTLPVLEFEMGAEWGRKVGRYDFLIQTTMVGQAWFNVGNAANQQNIFGSNSTDYQNTLGMIGLRVTAGVSY